MSKKLIEIFLLILSLILLGYLVDHNQQHLYYFFKGKLVKKLNPQTPYEIQIEKIKYNGIFGTSLHDDIIYQTGNWEPEVLGFLRDASQKSTKNQSIFLDIGANTGWHSLYMAQYAKTVFAVEPYPPVIDRLNNNIRINKISNIQVHAVGFSNQVGTFPFYTRDAAVLASGSFDSHFFNHHNTPPMILPLVVGDEYLKARGIEQIDLIKLDIEGYERYALLGLKQILKTNRPVVAMELNATEGGFSTKEQLIDTLPGNYQFFRIKSPPDIRTRNLGTHFYVYGPRILTLNEYYLENFDFDFNKQDNIAAIPFEKLPLFKDKV